jgi:hypothetical protein
MIDKVLKLEFNCFVALRQVAQKEYNKKYAEMNHN